MLFSRITARVTGYARKIFNFKIDWLAYSGARDGYPNIPGLVEVHDGVLLSAFATLEDHVIRLVTADIFSRFAAVYPPADRIECGKTNGATKHGRMNLGRQVHRVHVIVNKVGVKE